MAQTGRPKKAPDGLTNDIKVRVDDTTLLELDKYCEINGRTRAEAIRLALDDLLFLPLGRESFEQFMNKVGFNIQLVADRLKLIGNMIRLTMEKTEGDARLTEDVLRIYAHECGELMEVQSIFDYLAEEQCKLLELKTEGVKPEPEKQPRRKAKSK